MAAVDYLIVGDGVAGTTAAETLRRLAPDATITIVSAEPHPLYSRVLLPHVVKGKVGREKAFLRTAAQYAAKGIDLRLGSRAVRLDPGAHELALADGMELRYRKLLLATGGEALPLAVPGAALAGVVPFRTLEDADAISAALAALAAGPESRRHAAVVGGGFIGLEFPPFFEKFGIAGTMLIRGPRLWWRILDEEGSGLIEDALTGHGTRVVTGAALAACEGDGAIGAVRLADGARIGASFLGYGLGIGGAPAFVTDAGIAGGSHGIEADESLRTGAPDVWTAGDCARFRDVTVGRSHRLGNWLNAQEQGRYAAEAMAGATGKPFASLSSYATQIFGLSISMIGDLTAQETSGWVTRGSRAGGKLARLHLREGRVVGAVLLNILAERAPITALIKGKVPVIGREADLADPSFDLEKFL